MQNSRKCELDTKKLQTFYKANIPINVVRYPTFIEVVKVTSKAIILHKPLFYHAVHKPLLPKQSSIAKNGVEDKIDFGCVNCLMGECCPLGL
jgi:hypothetical protein